jgi:hypothetical protein
MNIGIAEVVGSNPTRSISFVLVEYGIGLDSFSVIVGQIQQQCQCRILPFVDIASPVGNPKTVSTKRAAVQ